MLLGRPVLWALATGGADGVRDCLDLYRADLAATMAQAGLPAVDEIDADVITGAEGPAGRSGLTGLS